MLCRLDRMDIATNRCTCCLCLLRCCAAVLPDIPVPSQCPASPDNPAATFSCASRSLNAACVGKCNDKNCKGPGPKYKCKLVGGSAVWVPFQNLGACDNCPAPKR